MVPDGSCPQSPPKVVGRKWNMHSLLIWPLFKIWFWRGCPVSGNLHRCSRPSDKSEPRPARGRPIGSVGGADSASPNAVANRPTTRRKRRRKKKIISTSSSFFFDSYRSSIRCPLCVVRKFSLHLVHISFGRWGPYNLVCLLFLDLVLMDATLWRADWRSVGWIRRGLHLVDAAC